MSPASAQAHFHQWLADGARDRRAQLKVLANLWLKREPRKREGTFSASDHGRCLRARLLRYHGEQTRTISKDLHAIFVNGDFVHLKHQLAGMQTGYLTDIEVPYYNEDHRLGGTVDGITACGRIAEIKSANKHSFQNIKTFGPPKNHLGQIHGYMLLTGLDQCVYLVECKDTQRLYETIVDLDPFIMEQVKRHLRILNLAVEKGRMLDCTNPGKCKDCP